MIQTRSVRISKPCDFANHFPENARYQQSNKKYNGVWLKLHWYDSDDMLVKLSEEMYCSNSNFSEDANAEPHRIKSRIAKIKRWEYNDQF